MMRLLKGAVAGTLALRAMERLIRSAHDQKTAVDEIHFAQTQDTWNIALSRYCPHGEPR